MNVNRIHVMKLLSAKIFLETSSVHVLMVSLVIRLLEDAENQANVSLIMIVPTQQFVKTQNVEILVKLQIFVVKMQFVELSVILQLADAHQTQEATQKLHVIQLNVLMTMNVTHKNLALTQNASIHVHCQMHAAIMPSAPPKIMSAFAHVNLEQLEMLFSAAHKFSTAAVISNAHRAQNVIAEFVQQFAQVHENV